MEYLRKSKLMYWTVWLLAAATLIFVSTKISFIFQPISTFVSTLFTPLIIAGFLYYLLNPAVTLLGKMNIKRIYGILIVFVLLIGVLVFLGISVFPTLFNQIGQLINDIPNFVNQLQKYSAQLLAQPWLKGIDVQATLNKMNLSIGNIVNSLISGVTGSLGKLIGTVANATIVIFTVPIILFYIFKDGEKFSPSVAKFLPKEYREQMIELLGQMNNTIASYISGQSLVCLFVGVFTFLGYLIIGMPYGLLLGLVAGVTNIIPYLGPYIGAAPAVIIALTISPTKALLVIAVVLVVQQIDGNFISPNVIGKTLAIHPLTIVVILLVAGNLAGVLGMVLGVPTYAVAKTVIIYIRYAVMLRKKHEQPTKEKQF